MVVFTGRTVEEAIETGLSSLGLSRLKAHIKVISREKKGFLGFGKKPAQVDIEELVEESLTQVQESPRPVPVSEPVQEEILDINQEMLEEVPATDELFFQEATVEEVILEEIPQAEENLQETVETSVEEKVEQTFEDFVASEFSQDQEEKADHTKDIEQASQDVAAYIEKIIYEMDLDASIETHHTNRQISLQIETPDAGRVIGYHGKVLKSLQLLAQNFLHDRYSRYFSVTINVHDYVEHRTETLIDYTQKIAARVLESGQDFIMDSMSNNERKIVHKTISKIDGVHSYSQGNDPNRYVVVSLGK
ncbi:RNA-binding cell elongation regulator Jag/EloR [Streptococcus loxodontisalivarius]|uniref:RNA-binding protein KhpB n=1 Tax=Streptococcus loxodontisalivarius TaxID=1349415 RepID=A0ABS2PS23_9STRE|nr:RNA-binding cell elongation regulator Jag/EloR [Streptococcus loxodontisalivarius]MBM7642842.1 spoIIIJ-associated protein [Streptococcus loxodontisalivarius]